MANRKVTKKQAKAAAKAISKAPVWVIVTALILVSLIVGGYFVYTKFFQKKSDPVPTPVPAVGEFSAHFLTLGNANSGDCVYIKAGENDILIDGGSRTNSVDDIKSYVDTFVTDGKIEYVIVTHAHQDHIACFAGDNTHNSLFDIYTCETIIDFPLHKSTSAVYGRYITQRDEAVEEGAKHYTALECYNNQNGARRTYELAESVSMEILYNYYYDHNTSDENDYSVCVMFTHGDRDFLFTGDLEKDGEDKLAENYSDRLGQVELFKAGHHGSYTASNTKLLSKIQPKVCVVSCVAGNFEYASKSNPSHTFPAQEFIDRIAKYTDKVYVTTLGSSENVSTYSDMNGTVIVSSGTDGVKVTCSNNDTLLKDTEWFKQNRTTPTEWAA